MRELQSKTRRNLVVAGVAGMATLAAPPAWQNRLAQGVMRPAQALSSIPPRTGQVKVQYGHRSGRWGLPARGPNAVPLAIYNLFGAGTKPVVEEVQIYFRLDFPYVKELTVSLISPDGHEVVLMDRIARDMSRCSHKGAAITFVDNNDAKFAPIADASRFCPENNAHQGGSWKRSHFHGIFHTHRHLDQRTLPQFKGRLAQGIWNLKVHNHLHYNVNKVIKQIDLTVYSKW